MLKKISLHKETIAWFFVILFYLELIMIPVSVKAENRFTAIRPVILPGDVRGISLNGKTISFPNVAAEQKPETTTPGSIKPVIIDEFDHVQGNLQSATSGPTQPETQSFQSVNGNKLVDLFTGDFSYNIPLLDVGGYPVNLHYQSGISMDQEASWVGLGWNINPGTINRNMRGVPDDFQGQADVIKKVLAIKENRTSGVTIGTDLEILGAGRFGISGGIFHNNYKGWGVVTGINASINAAIGSQGALTGGLSITNSSQDGLNVTPSLGVTIGGKESEAQGNVAIGTTYNSRIGIQGLQLSGQVRQQVAQFKMGQAEQDSRFSAGTGISSFISFSRPSYTPEITPPFTSRQSVFAGKVDPHYLKGVHLSYFVRGYQSIQEIEKNDRMVVLPSYGYLYYEKAKNNHHVLLDVNREKDIPYRDNTPHIAMPVYTYDTYSITGEGTGGMFRPYRSDIGYVYDHATASKSTSKSGSYDLGFGSIFHGGVDFNKVTSTTKKNPWEEDNAFRSAIGFTEGDSLYENVYFKNPGEKTAVDSEYLDAIGNESLLRVDLYPLEENNVPYVYATQNFSLFKNARFAGRKTMATGTVRKERDKRTQVISFLTAEDARKIGLDTVIKDYHINSFPSTSCFTNYDTIHRINTERQPHHISEMTVLNGDGRRYVYGIPVYNVSQADVSMSVGGVVNANTGHVAYTSQENSDENGKYYSKEELPAYSHAFLLSGILASDYVDITGDGITEDDNGDAIKFNYSRVYSASDPYTWRAPYESNKASYNEGLKTDNRDQKATYTYGKKEIWYLNSIESKTMIATFVLDTEVRTDANGVLDENGGLNTNKKLYRLKEIKLYTKADFLKNGPSNAKPIKTVHFSYSYNLCNNNPSSSAGGKLTLEKVWFTYNKNNKGSRHPYKFQYANNPNYKYQAYDRWGNYKDGVNNPGTTSMSNADYPYTLQKGVKSWDSTQAANNIAPWTLSEIQLPSGAKMKVYYESDEYAFVQDKRAMQFFSIAGIGSNADTATGINKLYKPNTSGNDYHFVFINVSEAVTSRADIERKYLQGVKKLFFKLSVKMPEGDKWGKGYEIIPCYADIEDYGVKGAITDKKIWIKLGAVKLPESALATAAVQFLRLNLPSKAYPYSEPGDNFNLKDVLGMLVSAYFNVENSVKGYSKYSREKNFCNLIDLEKSFVRLNNPLHKKFGGGSRVKKIEIYDNFNTMTSNAQKQSTYGQQYEYTTEIKENGSTYKISSGVASYEPMIGGDENPFHIPIEYTEKIGALAPANYLYSEEPFAETFFPAPVVGYSKVRVQTIHKDKKSATGVEETEFYTSKDFPTLVEFTALDNESKKLFKSPFPTALKFNTRNYVTLSQGFKVELNDMHGKMKSQASYAQNDLKSPVSYTYNYYRIEKDEALQKKLSNSVSVVDSANGHIRKREIGKEVELMIDVREQTSKTISGSVEVNVDLLSLLPPVVLGSAYGLPSFETNRYRAISVLKVVNRYGILDSIVHIEKGSQVSTRNILFDAETGDALLSRTNNEFNDPVYNFTYPAHWAYPGMGPAYKNIGATYKGVTIKQGKMFRQNGMDTFPVYQNHFESGDELLAHGRSRRIELTNDICSPYYYLYMPEVVRTKLWVIDAAKGKEGHHGLYFIDKDGKPYTGFDVQLKLFRSGKRNMSSVPVGTITSMSSPVRANNGNEYLLFDSTSGVVSTQAAKFKDAWKVDSTSYAKDTIIKISQPAITTQYKLKPKTVLVVRKRGRRFPLLCQTVQYSSESFPDYIIAESQLNGSPCSEIRRKTFLQFDFSEIPKGAVIQSAKFELYGHRAQHSLLLTNNHDFSNPHKNNPTYGGNSVALKRILNWPGEATLGQYFEERFSHDINNVSFGPSSSNDQNFSGTSAITCTDLVKDMVANKSTSNLAAMVFQLQNDQSDNRMCFYSGVKTTHGLKQLVSPVLTVTVYACPDTATVNVQGGVHQNTTYTCFSPRDSFVCKPNIVDTAINPYRWGIFGNWRMDRAYTYYAERDQSDPLVATNIRRDGKISSFVPYWSFSNTALVPSVDSSRWVWNSESTIFNSKGSEIENRDALNRFNSGQYGYNKTLPVAVAQNSKYREMVFDGFEDYDYNTDTCKKCPSGRFLDVVGTGTRIDTLSHTGKYSLYVGGNQSVGVSIPLTSFTQDTAISRMSIKIDSVPLINTIVNGNGTGLQGTYKTMSNVTCRTQVDPKIDFNWGKSPPYPGCPINFFEVFWTGKIQPRYTDDYIFHTNSDDGVIVRVNNQQIIAVNSPHNCGNDDYHTDGHNVYNNKKPIPIRLEAGRTYDIWIRYTEKADFAKIKLFWSSSKQGREVVPTSALYPPGAYGDTLNTKISDTTWCITTNAPKPSAFIINRFSPSQGVKVIVSGWVKEKNNTSGNYSNSAIELSFNAGTPNVFTLTPKGNIIEGWQRIEDTLTIPASATSATINLKALSSSAVFFDDFRIHPFQSNMKSFVYNPVNIRLMAELDENNYATFYEYDDDGTLIRVKKETERGIKTIKETRTGLLKQ